MRKEPRPIKLSYSSELVYIDKNFCSQLCQYTGNGPIDFLKRNFNKSSWIDGLGSLIGRCRYFSVTMTRIRCNLDEIQRLNQLPVQWSNFIVDFFLIKIKRLTI